MGQPQSSDGRNGRRARQEEVPYTMYSHSTPSSGRSPNSKATVKGVTVVNPNPELEYRATKPLELQKLDKVHRFWPILKSSLETVDPTELISDGVDYQGIQSMCLRYQQHLTECANIISMEQRALASRLKDLEMFTAGIVQQIIRRQERAQRVMAHLQRVNEVTAALDQIQSKLDHCIPLAQRLNSLLPEDQRLERLQPRLPSTRLPRLSLSMLQREEEEELAEESVIQFDDRPRVGGERRASRGPDEFEEEQLPFQ